MTLRDDSKPLYDLAGKFDLFATILFVVNTAAAVIAILYPQFLAEGIFSTQLISAICYVIVLFVTDSWLWFEAEKSRRLDCFSNGFGVDLSERKTDGYYNNPLPSSIQRYAANNFENTFYSRNTAKKMLPGAIIKIVLVLIVFVLSLRHLEKEDMMLLIAQTCFSAAFFSDQIMVIIFYFRVSSVYDRFYSAFVTDSNADTPQFCAKVLSYSIEYEAIKASCKVRLSTKIFERDGKDLDVKWKETAEKMCGSSKAEAVAVTHVK